jgi:hypothetical protein
MIELIIDVLLQVPLITLAIILYFFMYGVQVQKRVVQRQLKETINFLMHPLQVLTPPEKKKLLLEEWKAVPPLTSSSNDQEKIDRNKQMFIRTLIFSFVLVGISVVAIVVTLVVKQETFPTMSLVRSGAIVVAVMFVEIVFLFAVLTQYKVIDLDSIYQKSVHLTQVAPPDPNATSLQLDTIVPGLLLQCI